MRCEQLHAALLECRNSPDNNTVVHSRISCVEPLSYHRQTSEKRPRSYISETEDVFNIRDRTSNRNWGFRTSVVRNIECVTETRSANDVLHTNDARVLRDHELWI